MIVQIITNKIFSIGQFALHSVGQNAFQDLWGGGGGRDRTGREASLASNALQLLSSLFILH